MTGFGMLAMAAVAASDFCLVPAPRECRAMAGRYTVEVRRATDAAHFYDYDLTEACLAAAKVTEDADASLPAEGYRLSVTTGGVTIASADAAGRFYARETLRQLAVETATNAVAIPCCEIRDWPQYRWRGLMIDEARYFLGKTAVLRILDQMARHKLNVFHWHLTDDQGWRLDLSRHPELVRYGAVRPRSVKRGTHARWLPPGGELSFEYDNEKYGPFFYTRADVAEILAFAKERQITVVPEIEMPGHVRALLAAHPELSCRGDLPREPRIAWSIDEDVLCVGNDGTLVLLKDVLDEVCEIFPDAPYVHIGGDECPRVRWKSCPKCRKRIRDAGLADENGLQGWFVSQIVRHLEAKGRRAVGWDEVLSGDVPSSTVGMTWRRSDAEGARTGYVSACEALRRGHEMVLTPNGQCYLSRRQFATGDPHSYYSPTGPLLTLAKAYSFDPAAGIPEADRTRILGGQACVWGESVPDLHDFEWKAWPRACAIAESLWRGASKPGAGDFFRRMKGHRMRLVAQGVACAPLGESPCATDAALAAPAFEADLSAATSNVSVVNYQGRTPATFGTAESGRSYVTFAGSGDGKSSDTLWGVRTRSFAVTGGREYLVLVEMSGVIPVGATSPGVRLVWKAADGRELETQNAVGKTEALADRIRLPVRRNDGGTVRAFTRGKVPGTAARAHLDVVVDWPNLRDGETVSVRRLAYFETPAGEPIDLGDLEAPVLEVLNESPSADFTAPLEWRGQAIEVRKCRVSAMPFNRVWPGTQRPPNQAKDAYFMSFDVTEAGELSILFPETAGSVRVRPFRRDQGILEGRVFRTKVTQPEFFVVETGGTEYHVFAERPWAYEARPGDRYFGPGEHEAGAIVPRSGDRVVIDRGARVFGNIVLVGVTNVVVEGRGVIDTSRIRRVDHDYSGSKVVAALKVPPTATSGPDWGTAPVYARDCRGVTISGLTFVDAPRWTMNVDSCEDLTIDGVKLVGMWRYNSDGIDICDCRNVVVRNSFVRTFDDCIIARPPTYLDTGTEMRGLVVSNCVLWCDWGQCMKIQHSQLPSVIGDIEMRDISCLNVAGAVAMVTTRWGSSNSVVRNVAFENVRVDLQPERVCCQMQKADGQVYEPIRQTQLDLVTVNAYSLGKPAPNQGKPGRLDENFFGITYDGLSFENFSIDGVIDGIDVVSRLETSVPGHRIRNVRFARMPGCMRLIRKGNVGNVAFEDPFDANPVPAIGQNAEGGR